VEVPKAAAPAPTPTPAPAAAKKPKGFFEKIADFFSGKS
jgi:hypothetical protein